MNGRVPVVPPVTSRKVCELRAAQRIGDPESPALAPTPGKRWLKGCSQGTRVSVQAGLEQGDFTALLSVGGVRA